jgi:L-amino acid N-acyltransferase YncA
MNIREFKKEDQEQVEDIFKMYFTDPVFQKELSDELKLFLDQDDQENRYRFYVAEDKKEVVGIAGFKKVSDYLVKYTKTDNPVEFYIAASKYKRKGIGEKIKNKIIEETKKLGFTEIVFYSPDTHKDSWGFHDRLGFERVEAMVDPDGYPGMVWRKEI